MMGFSDDAWMAQDIHLYAHVPQRWDGRGQSNKIKLILPSHHLSRPSLFPNRTSRPRKRWQNKIWTMDPSQGLIWQLHVPWNLGLCNPSHAYGHFGTLNFAMFPNPCFYKPISHIQFGNLWWGWVGTNALIVLKFQNIQSSVVACWVDGWDGMGHYFIYTYAIGQDNMGLN